MSPRGTLPLKVKLPGCEPIRRLSGTPDRAMLKKLIRMLHTLHEQGRDDLVNGVASGLIHPLQLYNRWKFHRLEELPHAEEMPLFGPTWRKWLAAMECSDEHRKNTRLYFTRFEKRLRKDATIGDVVALVKDLRVEMRSRARSFNLARANIMAFLRDTVGKRHRFWLEVADVPDLKIIPKRSKHPLSPDALRELIKAMGEPWGPMAWTMATTGMGWKEYSGSWEREGDGLRIHGTKTKGRDRLIPLVSLLHPCEGTIYAFRWHLTKASDGRVTPYDLRRTFTKLMVNAGIPRPRRKLYMGHSPEDITALYEWDEVKEYLTKDAERMRSVLGEPEGGPSLQVVRA